MAATNTQVSRKQYAALHATADAIARIGKGAGVDVPDVLYSFDAGSSDKTRVFFTKVAPEKVTDGSFQKKGHLWRDGDNTYGQICISPRALVASESERGFYVWLAIGQCIAAGEIAGDRGSNRGYVNRHVAKRLEMYGIGASFPDNDGKLTKDTGPTYSGDYTVDREGPLGKWLESIPAACQMPLVAEYHDHTLGFADANSSEAKVLHKKSSKGKFSYTLSQKTGDKEEKLTLFGKGGQADTLAGWLKAGVTLTPEVTDAEFNAVFGKEKAQGEPAAKVTAKPSGNTGTKARNPTQSDESTPETETATATA